MDSFPQNTENSFFENVSIMTSPPKALYSHIQLDFVPARYVFVIVGLFAMIVVYGIQLDLSIPSGAKDMVSTAKSRKGGIFDPIREWIPILNNDTCRSFSTSGIEVTY